MATTSTNPTTLELPPPPPPPNGAVLALLAALSFSHNNSNNPNAHQLALKARDDALSSSPTAYGDLCVQFVRVLSCPSPELIPEIELKVLHDSDIDCFMKCCGWMQQNGNESGATTTVEHVALKKRQGMIMWNTLRQMAGLLLKNALVSPPLPANTPLDALGRVLPGHARRMELPSNYARDIKFGLLTCITDNEASVRMAASTAIARCCTCAVHYEKSMREFSISVWGNELIPFLLSCIVAGNNNNNNGVAATTTTTNPNNNGENGNNAAVLMKARNENAAMGALLTLRKLLEDIPNRFVKEGSISAASSFNDMVPALLQCLVPTTSTETQRKEALSCLNCLIYPMPGSLIANMDNYLAGLSSLATDTSADVRKLVCQGIVSLLTHRSEYLQPHISSIVEFMLRATSDNDATVALEACEFWLTFASLDDEACTRSMMEALVTIFPQLLPQLLKGMVYPRDKIEELMEVNALDEANSASGGAAHVENNVAPVFHKSRTKGHDDDGSDDDDDDDEMDDDDNEWTLRKCSAASLDALSGLFGASNILPSLLPALEEGLGHTDQWVREASILALGAIADGCTEELTPHLSQLHPFLVTQLIAPESLPQLRCIAAWTLARYALWTVDQMKDGHGDPSLIGQVAEALVGRMLAPHKKVQIAICSALGVFAEAVGDLLAPYLEPIYRVLMQALQMYGTRSRLVLFDTLGVMAEYVGPGIGEGALPGMYIPPLLQLWNSIAIENPFDRSLLPLMECLSSSTVVCGLNYQPWAMETFEMAMGTIETCTIIISHEDDLGDIDEEMTDPIICAVDLLDGLVEGLGPNFASLVNGSAKFGPTFPNVLQSMAEHFVSGVRMSAFALLGDLARQAPSLIEAGLSRLLSEAISSIDPMHPSMCNNAIWSIGEICLRCGGNPEPLNPHASNLLGSLIPLLMGNAVDVDGNEIETPGLAENAAATVGRLAMVNPNFVAPELGRFLLGWCDGMSKISSDDERRDAFQGFVAALRANPHSISSTGQEIPEVITAVLFAVVSWHIPNAETTTSLLNGPYRFEPFPNEYNQLLASLVQLLHDIKASAGETWTQVESQMPPNVKKLMQDVYQL